MSFRTVATMYTARHPVMRSLAERWHVVADTSPKVSGSELDHILLKRTDLSLNSILKSWSSPNPFLSKHLEIFWRTLTESRACLRVWESFLQITTQTISLDSPQGRAEFPFRSYWNRNKFNLNFAVMCISQSRLTNFALLHATYCHLLLTERTVARDSGVKNSKTVLPKLHYDTIVQNYRAESPLWPSQSVSLLADLFRNYLVMEMNVIKEVTVLFVLKCQWSKHQHFSSRHIYSIHTCTQNANYYSSLQAQLETHASKSRKL